MNELDNIFDPLEGKEIIGIKWTSGTFNGVYNVGGKVLRTKSVTHILRDDYAWKRFGVIQYIVYVDGEPFKCVLGKDLELTFKINED